VVCHDQLLVDCGPHDDYSIQLKPARQAQVSLLGCCNLIVNEVFISSEDRSFECIRVLRVMPFPLSCMALFDLLSPLVNSLTKTYVSVIWSSCDALCVGSMTSTRSALGLVGGVIVGRLSDHYGRRSALVLGLLAGIMSTIIFGLVDSLQGLWLSMLPSALLSHQFLVLKALSSDWAQAVGFTAAQRGAVMGQLGTAVNERVLNRPYCQ